MVTNCQIEVPTGFFLDDQNRQSRLALWGMTVVAFLSIAPLMIEPMCSQKPLQLDVLPTYIARWASWGTKIAVILAMLFSIKLYIKNHPDTKLGTISFCMVMSGAMIVLHWTLVDSNPTAFKWQKMVYTHVLNHQNDVTPHNLRPLPYGFARLLEWMTHDWVFSSIAYRWYFSFWFLLASYQFARLWLSSKLSYLMVAIMCMLYRYSIKQYFGQLTDPLSHWLFVMALIFVVEDQWLSLAMALALGILAKETAMLIVLAYWACWWRHGWPAFRKTAALGIVCAISFLSVRLPYGWCPRYEQINGTACSMFWANLRVLGFCFPHLTRFFIVFIPFIAFGWRTLDGRLKALCLTVVPLVLISSFWFGWVYESRNYMPLLPLLVTSALMVLQGEAEPQRRIAGISARTAERVRGLGGSRWSHPKTTESRPVSRSVARHPHLAGCSLICC